MKSNITDQQLWNPDLPLAEPHFDDEATLLSAQPVVPFRKLLAKPGLSRPWVFGLALAGALLLGVSATALYYSRVRTTGSEPVSNGETVSSGVHGFASDTVAPDESPIIEATEVTGSESSSVDSDTSSGVKAHVPSWTRRPPNSSNAVSKKPAHRRVTVVDQSSEREYESREERRAARREAKERKQTKRERRAGRSSDELLRIRDIFEGPQRP
jgi:hypothetical protein